MRRSSAVIPTLFGLGVVGGIYGAVFGAIYMELAGVCGAIYAKEPNTPGLTCALVMWGAVFGFPAGFLSGVLSGLFGGPVGSSIGGFIGTVATMEVIFGRIDAFSTVLVIYPGI